jgi:hypothetical protein
MALMISLVFHEAWPRIRDHLHLDFYARDRGVDEPRIRIGFVDLPDKLGRELVLAEMLCVTCQRPIKPLRRRIGDGFDRLYYAPCCPVAIRAACSRSRAAQIEYQRFAGLENKLPSQQLALLV